MDLEVFKLILTSATNIIASLAWPTSIILVAFLFRKRIQDLVLKHKDTEFSLRLEKATIDIKNIEDKIPETPELIEIKSELSHIQENLTNLKIDTKRSPKNIENGENANGRYWIHSSGQRGFSKVMTPGTVSGEIDVVFPIAFNNDFISITFSGEECPQIIHIGKSMMRIRLPYKNKYPIKITGFGF